MAEFQIPEFEGGEELEVEQLQNGMVRMYHEDDPDTYLRGHLVSTERWR